MSQFLASPTHVDAMLTAALRWRAGGTPSTDRVLQRHVASREVLDLAGFTLLWHATVQDRTKPVSHTFVELPGDPAPEVVLRLVDCYRYQSEWEGEGLHAVEELVVALEEAALLRSGLDGGTLRSLPRYQATPWGLEDSDRDLFVRLG